MFKCFWIRNRYIRGRCSWNVPRYLKLKMEEPLRQSHIASYETNLFKLENEVYGGQTRFKNFLWLRKLKMAFRMEDKYCHLWTDIFETCEWSFLRLLFMYSLKFEIQHSASKMAGEYCCLWINSFQFRYWMFSMLTSKIVFSGCVS